jgi:hypothetical protein
MKRNDTSPALFGLLVITLALAACGGAGRVVKNPIVSGDPLLTASVAPRSDTVRDAKSLWISAATCELWPIEDVVRVRVTDDRICVQTLRNEALPATQPFPASAIGSEAIALSSGVGSPKSLALSPDVGAPMQAAACHRPDGAVMEVWRVARVGCTDNDGFITDDTHQLTVNQGQADEIRWVFQDPRADRRVR